MRPHGSITALATPFTASGDVDDEAWRRLLTRQIDAGTQGVVVAGSTGEAAMLEPREFGSLLRAARDVAAGRISVAAGCGQSGTARTIEQCRVARDHGAELALVVTPPYVRPTQEGLLRHFVEVADRGGLPLLLYNVPSRTGCDLLPETVARLAQHPHIIGIKEARPEPERMQALLGLRSNRFSLLSGDDPTACRALRAGADGVISVSSNVAPASLRRLVDLARSGREEAAALDAELAPLHEFLGVEPNPIPAKALLAALGLCQDVLRLPLLPLSAEHRARLAALVSVVTSLEARSASGRAA